jgi:hypothetical protein
MAYDSQTRASINEHIKEHGLGNIVLHEVLGPNGPSMFALMCSVCCYQVQWSFNPDEPLGLELELLTSFCKNHLHGKEKIPQLSQPTTPEVEEGPFNLLGAIQTNIGGVEFSSKTVTAVSSTALKLIAKRSNFNVDLQCRPGFKPVYRGVCSQCGKESVLTREEVFDLDKGEVGPKFDSFLIEHKHDGSDRELPNGRKFRHASQ